MSEGLGERIRTLRHVRGLRRVDAARAAQVTSTWLSRVERGHIPRPDPEALARLAAVLGASVQEIVTGQPAAEPAGPAAAPDSLAERNRAVIEDLVSESVNHGNFAVVDLVLAPSYTLHGPFPDVTLGRDLVKRLLNRLRRAFPDLSVRIDEIIPGGERVVVRWTMTGTHAGSVRGVPPSGARLTHVGIAIFGMSDGRVTEAWMTAEATDRELLRQLGFSP